MAPIPVVLVPPLLAPSLIMQPLGCRLRAAGFTTHLFRYPSYREDIPANGARLAHFLGALGPGPLDVVAFSMGGIITRWAASHHAIPPLRRVVMIGTPNRGALMAAKADQWLGPAFPLFWGACARQLRPGDEGLCESAGLLAPETEVGIIAGGTGRPVGINPFLPGDNDRIVRVEETRLEGMRDFALVRAHHGPLILHRETAALTIQFLRTGRFRPAPAVGAAPPTEATRPCPT
jgi:pimeloyl-ACP methyl ester carboxylesterase